MRHRDLLEIAVAQRDVVYPELLEIDGFGGTPVELEHDRSARARHDRRRSPWHAAVRNADTDRRLADEGDCDHAPRHGLSVGELGSGVTAGGSPGERDAPTRDIVAPGD